MNPTKYAGEKVACIDFDGTIVPFRPLYENNPPIAGAIETINYLRRSGYEIVIYTSRLSPTWCKEHNEDLQKSHAWVESILDQYGVPYDKITSEKIPAEFYIDDRAIEFRGSWAEVLHRLKSERKIN